MINLTIRCKVDQGQKLHITHIVLDNVPYLEVKVFK